MTLQAASAVAIHQQLRPWASQQGSATAEGRAESSSTALWKVALFTKISAAIPQLADSSVSSKSVQYCCHRTSNKTNDGQHVTLTLQFCSQQWLARLLHLFIPYDSGHPSPQDTVLYHLAECHCLVALDEAHFARSFLAGARRRSTIYSRGRYPPQLAACHYLLQPAGTSE